MANLQLGTAGQMSPTNSELICLMVYKWYLLATTISCAVRACAFVSGEPDLKKLSEDFELAIQICNPDLQTELKFTHIPP